MSNVQQLLNSQDSTLHNSATKVQLQKKKRIPLVLLKGHPKLFWLNTEDKHWGLLIFFVVLVCLTNGFLAHTSQEENKKRFWVNSHEGCLCPASMPALWVVTVTLWLLPFTLLQSTLHSVAQLFSGLVSSMCYRLAFHSSRFCGRTTWLVVAANNHNSPQSSDCQCSSCLLAQTLPELNLVTMPTFVAITPFASDNVVYFTGFIGET